MGLIYSMLKGHSYIQKRLLHYFDRELPEKELKQVEHHLESCTTCRILADHMRSLYLADSIEPCSLPPFLYSRISSRLQNPPDRLPLPSGWLSYLRPALAGMMLILSILAGHFLGSFASSSSGITPVSREQVVYESFGLNSMDPFAEHSIAGAVNAVYSGQ